MENDQTFMIENRFQILDQKFSKIFGKSKIFDFSDFSIFRKFSMKILIFSIFRFFEKFRKFRIFNENPMKILIFQNFRKFFDQNFEIDFRSEIFDRFP